MRNDGWSGRTNSQGRGAATLRVARYSVSRPDAATVIPILVRSDATYVNGVVIPVDGGLSASNGEPRLG